MKSESTLNMHPRTIAILRRAFHFLNRYMLLMWRLDMQWWFTLFPRYTGQIMILTHTGHKSGLRRRTPLNYAIVEDELYCTAGFGKIAHWYRNIMAIPQVEICLPEGCWAGIAEDVTEYPDALDLMRQVLIGSGFATFAAGINPYTLTDDELAEATQGYRLIHIQRTHPITPPKEIGDLRWIWQVATFLLLMLLPFLRRRRKK